MDPTIAVRAAFKSARYPRKAFPSARFLSIGTGKYVQTSSNSGFSRAKLPSLHNCQRRPLQVQSPIIESQRRHSSDDASPTDGGLNRTALHQLHIENGGKMVPFGGYSMPAQYSDLSVGESHKWTREKASLFDVGHMCAQLLSGIVDTSINHYTLGSNIASPAPALPPSSNK